jgi:hypothetical protein
MCRELKIAVVPYFKLISQAEENHDKLKVVCVIEIRFRQVYLPYQYKQSVLLLTDLSVSCVVASCFLRKAIG